MIFTWFTVAPRVLRRDASSNIKDNVNICQIGQAVGVIKLQYWADKAGRHPDKLAQSPRLKDLGADGNLRAKVS